MPEIILLSISIPTIGYFIVVILLISLNEWGCPHYKKKQKGYNDHHLQALKDYDKLEKFRQNHLYNDQSYKSEPYKPIVDKLSEALSNACDTLQNAEQYVNNSLLFWKNAGLLSKEDQCVRHPIKQAFLLKDLPFAVNYSKAIHLLKKAHKKLEKTDKDLTIAKAHCREIQEMPERKLQEVRGLKKVFETVRGKFEPKRHDNESAKRLVTKIKRCDEVLAKAEISLTDQKIHPNQVVHVYSHYIHPAKDSLNDIQEEISKANHFWKKQEAQIEKTKNYIYGLDQEIRKAFDNHSPRPLYINKLLNDLTEWMEGLEELRVLPADQDNYNYICGKCSEVQKRFNLLWEALKKVERAKNSWGYQITEYEKRNPKFSLNTTRSIFNEANSWLQDAAMTLVNSDELTDALEKIQTTIDHYNNTISNSFQVSVNEIGKFIHLYNPNAFKQISDDLETIRDTVSQIIKSPGANELVKRIISAMEVLSYVKIKIEDKAKQVEGRLTVGEVEDLNKKFDAILYKMDTEIPAAIDPLIGKLDRQLNQYVAELLNRGLESELRSPELRSPNEQWALIKQGLLGIKNVQPLSERIVFYRKVFEVFRSLQKNFDIMLSNLKNIEQEASYREKIHQANQSIEDTLTEGANIAKDINISVENSNSVNINVQYNTSNSVVNQHTK